MAHKSKITPATSPLLCNTPYLANLTLLLISMLYFRMCNIWKFTQNSLVVLIPYLFYSQQYALWRHYYVTFTSYAFMHNVFCFNGFNYTAIVLRYSAYIKPRKTIKNIKTENCNWFNSLQSAHSTDKLHRVQKKKSLQYCTCNSPFKDIFHNFCDKSSRDSTLLKYKTTFPIY